MSSTKTRRRAAAVFTLVLLGSAIAFSRPAMVVPPELSIQLEARNPWTNLKLANRPENFQFAIVSDRTGGHRPGVFESAMGKLNLLQPEFVMSVGDLIEGGGKPDVATQWTEFNAFVDGLEMPFFYVAGNHDLGSEKMIPEWQSRFGRAYYHFVYHNVLFMVLNSEDPPGYTIATKKPGRMGDEQLAWAAEVLRDNDRVRWTILFIHKPMWQYGPMTNWDRMERALGDRPRTVFAGHHHRYVVNKVGPHTYYALATTGGASKLLGPAEGSFDHVAWVTMTPDGPKLANLMLDGIWTDDPETEARAAQSPAAAPSPAAAK